MMAEQLINLTKEAILVTVIASMPSILMSLIVGLLIAVFSATTQIQEQTLSFAPKMIAVYGTLLAFGAPIGSLIINFTKSCFTQFVALNP